LSSEDILGRSDSHSIIHLGERLFGLIEESKHDRSAILALIILIIHFQYLLEAHSIDNVAEIWQTT
jgi:hypothetical protein